jgi:HSP20 family protein
LINVNKWSCRPGPPSKPPVLLSKQGIGIYTSIDFYQILLTARVRKSSSAPINKCRHFIGETIMSALTRFERMDDMFPDLFRRMFKPMPFPADLPQEISLNVTENDKDYLVKAEIPGAKKEDIRVSIDGNKVSISAEVKHESEKKEGERVLIRELTQGSVARGITLGFEVDEKESQAKFENGILQLVLPKRQETRGRTLSIK